LVESLCGKESIVQSKTSEIKAVSCTFYNSYELYMAAGHVTV